MSFIKVLGLFICGVIKINSLSYVRDSDGGRAFNFPDGSGQPDGGGGPVGGTTGIS
jgi:hypothetical protein